MSVTDDVFGPQKDRERRVVANPVDCMVSRFHQKTERGDFMHQLIMDHALSFEANNRRKPTRVYLGRMQMKALLKWARENDYIACSDEEAKIEGSNRPEVAGLLVYAVNEDDHIFCG